MDYADALAKFENLRILVDQYSSSGNAENRAKMTEAYGRVSDLYREIAGHQRVQVPVSGSRLETTFPNMFEAGYLSDRTFNRSHGHSELLRVIGQVRERAERQKTTTSATPGKRSGGGDRVFIVHGHNEAMVEGTARFVEKLGLQPTVLREEANKGRTIIEKFEDHADEAGFAIVLLTADDLGAVAPRDGEAPALRPRARQNAILELGYFAGRLGREKVCAVYLNGVELPSDLQGVLYVSIDAGGAWKMLLARELKAAQLPVDMNKAI